MLFTTLILFLSTASPLVLGDTHEALVKKSATGKQFYVKTGPTTQQIVYSLHLVTFEYATPNWTKPIRLIGYTCTGDDYDNDGWSCPVLWYWLTQVRDRIQEEIYVDNMKIPDLSKFRSDLNCEFPFDMFDGLYMDEATRAGFYSYVNTVTCPSGQPTILEKSNKYIADTLDDPYRTMREKFFEEYYNLQTPVNRSNDAMYTNARYNYYSSGLFDYYIESRRWTDALDQCKARRIPNTLIPPEDLRDILTSVAANVSLHGLELNWPLDEVSRYYKESGFVDCAFTPDSMIVGMRISVKTMGAEDHKAVDIIPIPYYNKKGRVCTIDLDEEKFVTDPVVDRLVPQSQVKCNKEGLCHLESQVEHGLRRKSCAEVLYKEGDDAGVCRSVCRNSNSYDLPMITKVANDRVVVFGSGGPGSATEVKIVCPDFQKMEPINSLAQAMEVTVPCGCEIHKRGKSVFKPTSSGCGAEVHVINL